jgi:hypothetical protein
MDIYVKENIYGNIHLFFVARVRIYSDAASVGTNNNVIGTYVISSSDDGPGKFSTWKQEKI